MDLKAGERIRWSYKTLHAVIAISVDWVGRRKSPVLKESSALRIQDVDWLL